MFQAAAILLDVFAQLFMLICRKS